MKPDVAAHTARQTHRYWMHFPDHAPREGDPHYKDFNAYHDRHRDTARCYVGERIGFGECRTAQGEPATFSPAGKQLGLELHHRSIEFALVNGISLAAFETDHPGISNPDEVGEWVESSVNLRWLCAYHHRGAAGAHTVAHADWEASLYVPALISGEPS